MSAASFTRSYLKALASVFQNEGAGRERRLSAPPPKVIEELKKCSEGLV
jgi:hypothetical protein